VTATVRRPARTVGLGIVLVALSTTLLLGFLEKAEPGFEKGRLVGTCLGGLWDDRRALVLCYSDIVPLYSIESLRGNRLPYLDACTPPGWAQCDEYPVLTMYTMWLAALLASSHAGFFYANALLLSIAALTTAVCLYRMVGRRALYFALAPTLLIYGFINWDLVAVALATAATLAFAKRRDGLSGILIGLGTAAKLYPGLLLIPFVLHRFHQRDREGGIRLAWSAVGTWLAVNLPFMILAPEGWSTSFRFGAERALRADSLWYIGCRVLRPGSGGQCVPPRLADAAAAALVVFVGTALWRAKTRRDPLWQRWTFAFPLIALFLLTNKVYSPQYSLWLLPWFALVLPGIGRLSPLGLFLLFEACEVVLFVTEFQWFNWQYGLPGAPGWAFALAVVARDVVLALSVLAWVRRAPPRLPALRAVEESVAA
jgi:uncharacterized membrane protein